MRASRFSGTFLKPAKPDRISVAGDANAGRATEPTTPSATSPGSAGPKTFLHYEVQAKLGEGGMGIVYQALDRKLNRLVALKFLPPLADRSNIDLERFLQEANALSSLNHPHIATIYAVETAGEQQFLVLEYLPGGTLKAKLQRTYSAGAPLPIDDVLKYAQQTAEGLAHAHAKGIIHRDVKTSNLMLTEGGDAKITDFGVAKLSGSSLKTIPGSLLGTIAYMSPEQALGVEVDARSDVFSFGVVLFELISGRLPFEAPNDAALLTRVVNARAPELKTLRADAPETLERIVGRALKKRLEDRYATMGELLADIREVRARLSTPTRSSTRHETQPVVRPERHERRMGAWAAIALAVLTGAIVLGIRHLVQRVPAGGPAATVSEALALAKPTANRLALAQFDIFGQEQGKETFSKDLTAELTKYLTQFAQTHPSLSVVSPDEKRKDNVPTLILKATAIWENDRLIIAAVLADAQKRSVLNSVDLEGPANELPGLLQSLAKKVAEMLQVQISEAPEARELYLRGRGYLERYDRPENLENAIAAFNKALSQDGAFVLAHAGKAEAYLRKYRQAPDEAFLDVARESVATAMQLNDRLAAVHFSDGLLRAATGEKQLAINSFQRSLEIEPGPDATRELANAYDSLDNGELLDLAELTYRRAIDLRKGYWLGYKDLGVFYQKHGRLSSALPLFERVLQLAPDDHTSYTNLGGIYLKLHRYSDYVRFCQKAVEIEPSAFAYYSLGTALYLDHRHREAIDAYKRAVELEPTEGFYFGGLGDAYRFVPGMVDYAEDAYKEAIRLKEKELQIRPRDARLRASIASWCTLFDRRRALSEIDKALQLGARNPRVQAVAATVFEQLRMREQAIKAVEKAIDLGYSVAEFQSWPPLEKLRKDPRYKRIAKRELDRVSVKTRNQ